MKQQNLFVFKNTKSYGGKVNLGKRKESRPLNKNRLLHVVARSEHARGVKSFKNFHHKQQIQKLIYDKAHRYGVRIAEFANVGNHFHLLIRFQAIHLLKTFFKVTLGLIARLVTKAQKGKKFGRFWDGLVFTRVVSKGKDEARIFDYIIANQIESESGSVSRQEFQARKKEQWDARTKKA